MDNSSITRNTYNKAAQAYWEQKRKVTLYNPSFDAFCAIVPKNAKLLEIGCGPGNVSRYLLDQRPDLKITGIDLAPNMVSFARTINPTATYRVMDCREIASLEQGYNAVLAAFVLPYLTKEECAQLIIDCAAGLPKGGMLYVSTMEGDYKQSGFEDTSFSGGDQVHIYYHQKNVLDKFLMHYGFKVIQFIRQECPEPDGRIFTDMIFLAKKV